MSLGRAAPPRISPGSPPSLRVDCAQQLPGEHHPWQLGKVREFQLLNVRLAPRHRSVNALVVKPSPARC